MRTFFLIAALAALSILPAAAAPLAINVWVDTSSVAGANALLDFQFNPGMFGATDAAGITIWDFSTDGVLAPAAEPVFGGVTGQLPGAVRIDNSDFYNDYAHLMVLGNTLSFRVVYSGPGVEAPTGQPFGSSFAFAILDASTFASILATTDPDGFLVRTEVPETGGVSAPQGFAENPALLDLQGPLPVPEPSTGLLIGAGLIAAAALSRRKRR